MRPTLQFQRERFSAVAIKPPALPTEDIPEESREVRHGLLESCRFALDGLRHVAITQRHFRLQLICAALTIGAGFYLHIQPTEWAILLTMLALVLTMEMINTALEHAVDLVTREYHPLAKAAKDVAAAAVMLAVVLALAVGALIFVPHILEMSR